MILREVRVVWLAVEGELENPCPGQVELVAERTYVGRDDPQVLGKEGEGAELFLHGAEKFAARARDPLSDSSR
jgi:hypothetical protein